MRQRLLAAIRKLERQVEDQRARQAAQNEIVEMTDEERAKALENLCVEAPERLCWAHGGDDLEHRALYAAVFCDAGRSLPWEDASYLRRVIERGAYHDPATRPYLEALLADLEQQFGVAKNDHANPAGAVGANDAGSDIFL